MTVGELIKQLQELDQDRIVILQKDSEGNGYSPLEEAYGINVAYFPDSTWSGSVGFESLTPEMLEEGYTEDDLYEDDEAQPCVILCPVN